jgi:hypothetical protein
MNISAMKQALGALKNSHPYSNMDKDLNKHSEAITTLRTAIEEAEKQEPEHSIEVRCFGPHISFITREPMSQYKDGDCFYRIKKEKNT